jgi:hypothetical protein
MNDTKSKLSFASYFLILPLNFIRFALCGLKTTRKGWLLLITIFFSIGSFFLLDHLNTQIPNVLKENVTELINNDTPDVNFQTEAYRIVPIGDLFDFVMFSEPAIMIIYPLFLFLASLGVENRKQGMICLASSFVWLIILLFINNFYYFQKTLNVTEGAFLLLSVSYYFLITSSLGLILSNFTLSKFSKGLTGFVFSLIFLGGFILMYRFFNRSTKIYDIMIIYSLMSIIINYYLLRNFIIKPDLSIDFKYAHSTNETDYNVFISYRRSTNVDAARLIRTALNSKNIKAFVDIEDLGPKFFDEQLIEVIKRTGNFILLISPEDLKKCSEPLDWLRREIKTAIQFNRNIVPILKDGFSWDASILPEDIRDLPRHNSIKYSAEYFDAMIIKLVSFLNNTMAKDKFEPTSQKTLVRKFSKLLRSLFEDA